MNITDTIKQELKFLQALWELTAMKPNSDKTVTAMGAFTKSAQKLIKDGQIAQESLDLFLEDYELTKQIKEAKIQAEDAKKKLQELVIKQSQIKEAKKEAVSPKIIRTVDPCGGSGRIIRSHC